MAERSHRFYWRRPLRAHSAQAWHNFDWKWRSFRHTRAACYPTGSYIYPTKGRCTVFAQPWRSWHGSRWFDCDTSRFRCNGSGWFCCSGSGWFCCSGSECFYYNGSWSCSNGSGCYTVHRSTWSSGDCPLIDVGFCGEQQRLSRVIFSVCRSCLYLRLELHDVCLTGLMRTGPQACPGVVWLKMCFVLFASVCPPLVYLHDCRVRFRRLNVSNNRM